MNLKRASFNVVVGILLLTSCPASVADISPANIPTARPATAASMPNATSMASPGGRTSNTGSTDTTSNTSSAGTTSNTSSAGTTSTTSTAAAAGNTSSAAAASTSVPVPAPSKDGPPSLFDEGQGSTQPTASLDVRINVPHAQHPIDVFTVHPYPIKPPKIIKTNAPLPETLKEIKGLLVQTGYVQRESGTRPYPFVGTRWQYAYKTGVAKSGLAVPHGLFTMYSWAQDVAPYVQKECLKWNAFEGARLGRYNKAVAEFDNHRADFESEAVKQGLYAIDLRHRGFGWGAANIPPGNWWLTCTRKVPGLTYYWQVPMTAAPGENIKVMLTEANALVITGGW